jgi:hypothetical protein
MDDLNEQLHPDYLKGFNDGYLIGEHIPGLASQLAKANGKSLKLEGMKAGIEQYQLEKNKTKEQNKEETNKDYYPTWITLDRSSTTEKDKDDKDKDNIEPGKE